MQQPRYDHAHSIENNRVLTVKKSYNEIYSIIPAVRHSPRSFFQLVFNPVSFLSRFFFLFSNRNCIFFFFFFFFFFFSNRNFISFFPFFLSFFFPYLYERWINWIWKWSWKKFSLSQSFVDKRNTRGKRQNGYEETDSRGWWFCNDFESSFLES